MSYHSTDWFKLQVYSEGGKRLMHFSYSTAIVMWKEKFQRVYHWATYHTFQERSCGPFNIWLWAPFSSGVGFLHPYSKQQLYIKTCVFSNSGTSTCCLASFATDPVNSIPHCFKVQWWFSFSFFGSLLVQITWNMVWKKQGVSKIILICLENPDLEIWSSARDACLCCLSSCQSFCRHHGTPKILA